jgi:4,5-DOPA dioxygenase extradiol
VPPTAAFLVGGESSMRMQVLFVGHGSPMNAIEENSYTKCLQNLSKTLPVPKGICVVSAHWVTSGSHVLTAQWPKTIHDFYGFPKSLYAVEYPAPGAPEEAKRLAFEHHLIADHEWGFDHGTWSVLRHLYPGADIPVFQVSLDHGCTFDEHIALGRELLHLRDQGILILGSGNLVHNLHQINWQMPHLAYPWAEEFDSKVKWAIENRDIAALASPDKWGETLLANAHPTLEHYAPLLYCMGCTDERDIVSYPHEGIEFGTISMRLAFFQQASSQ